MDVEQSTVQPAVVQQSGISIRPGRLSRRATARLAWSLLGLGIGLLALMLVLALVNDDLGPGTLIYLLTFNTFLVIGAMIAAGRPENPIGWMFCAVGLTTNLSFVFVEYFHLALSSQPESLPGGVIAGWLVMLLQPIAWALVFMGFMLFPTGRPVSRIFSLLFWIFAVLFGVSIIVDAITARTLSYSPGISNPFYIAPMSVFNQILDGPAAAFGILVVGISALLRYRRSSPVERLQLKWVTYSVVLLVLWTFVGGLIQDYLGNVFDIPQVVSDILGVLSVLWLGIAVAIAMLRYRLYDIDLIINRTLVYVPLTGILAGLYAAGVGLLQRLFQSATGVKSDVAIVLTTLILTALFTPIKNGLQAVVDTRWKEPSGSLKKLKAFGKQVEESISPVDPAKVMRRLLMEATAALRARSGAVFVQRDGQMQLMQSYGDWQEGGADLAISLESAGEQVGLIKLGERGSDADYSDKERKTLQEVASKVAAAISV